MLIRRFETSVEGFRVNAKRCPNSSVLPRGIFVTIVLGIGACGLASEPAAPRATSFAEWSRCNAKEGAICEFSGTPVVTPSGRWVVAPLSRCGRAPVSTEAREDLACVGVLALDLAEQRASVLECPTPLEKAADTANCLCDPRPMGSESCAIFFYSYPVNGATGCFSPVGDLWKWDLNDNHVAPLGRWPLGLHGLVPLAVECECRVSWCEDANTPWTGEYRYHWMNTAASRRMPIRLAGSALPELALLQVGWWFLPGASPEGYLTCQTNADTPIAISCVRHRSEEKPKWRFDAEDFRRVTNVDPDTVVPLRGHANGSKTLTVAFDGVFRNGSKSGQPATGVLTLDAASGRPRKAIFFESVLLPTTVPTISPDGKYVIYYDTEYNTQLYSSADFLVVVELASGNTKRTLVEGTGYMTYPCGWRSDRSFLTSDKNALVEWELVDGQATNPKEVFRLTSFKTMRTEDDRRTEPDFMNATFSE